MVRICSVHSCNSHFVKGGQVSLHLFPTDPEKRKIWATAVKVARKTNWNFVPGKFSFICSKHFGKSSFNNCGSSGSFKYRSLKRNAIPTIFYPNPNANPTIFYPNPYKSDRPPSSCTEEQQHSTLPTNNISEENMSSSHMEIEDIRQDQQQSDVQSLSDSSVISDDD